MKHSFFIFILIFLIPDFLIGQIDIDALNVDGEPGKVYSLCNLDQLNRKLDYFEETVLEISAAKWEIVLDTIYADTTKLHETFRTEIKSAATKWVLKKNLGRNCLSCDPSLCIVLALVETPAQYQTLTHKNIQPFKVMPTKKLIVPATIKVSQRKFDSIQLSDSEYVKYFKNEQENILYAKLKAGYWSKWRELICSSPHQGYTMRMIQQALKDHGYYRGPIDDKISDELRAAAIRFQKDNKLPIGQFNFETLKRLGINY